MTNGTMTAAKPLPSIEQKPRIAGIIGTIAFWAAFFAFTTIFSLFARKPVYQTIQIRLDAPQPKTQDAHAAAAPTAQHQSAQTALPAQQIAPALASGQPAQPQQPAPQTTPQSSAQTAPAQSASTPAASKSAQHTAKPAANTNAAAQTPKPTAPKPIADTFEPQFFDPMEQFTKNTAQKPTATAESIDWDTVAENSSSDDGAAKQNAQTNTVTNALGGSAGRADTSANTAASATSAKKDAPAQASRDTSDRLGDIANQSKVDGGGSFPAAPNTIPQQTDGNADIRFTSGADRHLLSDPKIELSPDAQKAITGQVQMQISFTVRADGIVTNVIIPSYLPQNVRREIEGKISRWRFTPGTSDDTAVFNYKITE